MLFTAPHSEETVFANAFITVTFSLRLTDPKVKAPSAINSVKGREVLLIPPPNLSKWIRLWHAEEFILGSPHLVVARDSLL
jgi:hypothetical protein